MKRPGFIRMKRLFLVLSLLALAGCGAPRQYKRESERMTQISVINALMIGRYEGVTTISELLHEGDFGVGTLDHLDGELIILDGTAYQVRGDGVVATVGAERSTPFATVTWFRPEGAIPCPAVATLSDLDARLSKALPQKNDFVAIRIEAKVASITIRSVHRQEPPYKPLSDVAQSQSVWTPENIDGTFVGIRCPTWVGGLNVPGYHWHFLSNDHKIGGHVLDCRILEGRIQYVVRHDWLIKLEDSKGFEEADLGQDLSRELRRVESSRGNEPEGESREPKRDPPR